MNKVVLITGASRGIGRRLAVAFGRSGHTVAVNFLKEKERALETRAAVEAAGGRAVLCRADVSRPSEVAAMVKTLRRSEGRIDVLINNAAIVKDRLIMNMSGRDWDDVVRTNLSGAFFVLKECARVMVRQRSGAIINISSLAGLRGAFGMANYASAKGALLSLTASAARELGRYHVRVNAVFPGFHLTDMGAAAPAVYVENVRRESVLGTTTDAGELADFIVLLAGTKTVSGQMFNWDSRIL